MFMTTRMCVSRCSLGGYLFAGVQAGNVCWCGAHLDGALAENQRNCNVPCPGYTPEICGGAKALSVFKAEGVDLAVSSIITTAPAASTLSTSGSLSASSSLSSSSSSETVLTVVPAAGATKNLAMFGWLR
ncbi:hypothetical protein B0T16DRAFT_409519 [Cercophora newfieldiana]|uniref:WSC domain-containing protein n=1 Tax=Cercophora newfieldiana TaxID=92897 RepID=A0AA40CTX9_9PEZI|nr:hypothetical protein B0T16DRAFT_409519 [Cercophora newfieldiana]